MKKSQKQNLKNIKIIEVFFLEIIGNIVTNFTLENGLKSKNNDLSETK